jgi:hypothetical protein
LRSARETQGLGKAASLVELDVDVLVLSQQRSQRLGGLVCTKRHRARESSERPISSDRHRRLEELHAQLGHHRSEFMHLPLIPGLVGVYDDSGNGSRLAYCFDALYVEIALTTQLYL